jgi:hypothetical protein
MSKTTETEKTTIKHRNADAYDPRDLLIVGEDLPDDENDPLYDPERVAEARKKRKVSILSIKLGNPVPPVICIKRTIDGADRLVVKDGRIRTFDVRYANLELEAAGEPIVKVQVVLHTGMNDTEHALGVATYNSHGVRETPMTRVLRAARLLRRTQKPDGSYDWEAVRVPLNLKTTASLRGYLRLAEGDVALHKAVEAGHISATAASVLAALPKENQAGALKTALDSGSKAVDDVLALVKSLGVEVEKLSDEGVTAPDETLPSASPRPAKKKDENADLAGRPPKKRIVTRIMKRAVEKMKDEATDEATKEKLDLCVKLMTFLQKPGASPPQIIAAFVRAEKQAEAERKAKKLEKAAGAAT